MPKYISIGLLLLVLTSCKPLSPYEKDKTFADIPAHIETVYLEKIYISEGRKKEEEPPEDTNPSSESREMLEVAKPSIISQLTNYGYKVVETPGTKADILMRCGVHYFNLWPLANDTLSAWCGVYDTDTTPILKLASLKQRAGIISALVGPTRQEMGASVVREAVIAVVNEMRKGTKEKVFSSITAVKK